MQEIVWRFYLLLTPTVLTASINIHTHRAEEDNTISIVNIRIDELNTTTHPHVSIGIHPRHIAQCDVPKCLELIRANAAHKNVKAIGECGLDRLTDTDLSIQKTIFTEQINIAETVQKPLIIHCVKAFDELIHIQKEHKIIVPAIVHGYNNNEIIANQLLQHNFYLSFGKALLVEHSNAQKIITQLAYENFFLETDDATVSINAIFEKAALLKNVTVDELKEKMMLNFKRLFSYE